MSHPPSYRGVKGVRRLGAGGPSGVPLSFLRLIGGTPERKMEINSSVPHRPKKDFLILNAPKKVSRFVNIVIYLILTCNFLF